MYVAIQNSLGAYVDITPLIADKGLKWTLSDIDASDSGRTLDGYMHRKVVAKKVRLDITCIDMNTVQSSILLNLIDPTYINVQYEDPKDGMVVRQMYSNNRPATYARKDTDGNEWWTGIAFPLIEA